MNLLQYMHIISFNRDIHITNLKMEQRKVKVTFSTARTLQRLKFVDSIMQLE